MMIYIFFLNNVQLRNDADGKLQKISGRCLIYTQLNNNENNHLRFIFNTNKHLQYQYVIVIDSFCSDQDKTK
jgi:hypothetical protein